MKKYTIKFNDKNCVELSKPINTILVYRIPYQNIKNKDHEVEISNRFIVYILYGTNKNGKDIIYVGKSKNGIDYRPTSHEDKNADWTHCYVLTDIKERTILNDGTIQYLEDKICNRVNEIDRYINTTNQTTTGTANHSDIEDCDAYLTEVYDMLYVLGLDLFEQEDVELPRVEKERHTIKPRMAKLYDELVKEVVNLNKDIIFTPMKHYIKATIGKQHLFDIECYKEHILICFNAKYGDLVDSNNLLEDMRNIGHHGNGDYRIKINDNTYLKDIVDFINQVINL